MKFTMSQSRQATIPAVPKPQINVFLEYQEEVPGKKIGRYIDYDEGTPVPDTHRDVHKPTEVVIRNGRTVEDSPSFLTHGFQLFQNVETKLKTSDEFDDAPLTQNGSDSIDDTANSSSKIRSLYYPEMESLIKRAVPEAKKVIIFDHTVRKSSQKNLNTLGAINTSAAPVDRVHCDYTTRSGIVRLQQLAEKGCGYTGEVDLTKKEVEQILVQQKRFMFINVWRSIDEKSPILKKPLALCDLRSIDATGKGGVNGGERNYLIYEMVYKDREGESYALSPPGDENQHKWYYYPQMEKHECIVFKVYDRKEELGTPRFVFHTAFDDPTSPPDAPNRMSIETRAIAIFDEVITESRPIKSIASAQKPIFFDMIHSNNAARVRLWLRLQNLDDEVETKLITYADLQSPEYEKINPCKKAPAMVTKTGKNIFESQVILQYCEDLFGSDIRLKWKRKFDFNWSRNGAGNPELSAEVNLLIRVHDIYISSPNCTQPGFSHTQGCMYLAPYVTEFCSAERAMDHATRAAKLAEIWKKLHWLEGRVAENGGGPFLAGKYLSQADMVWHPTIVFMEYLLPKNFGWRSDLFYEQELFPNISRWWAALNRGEFGENEIENVMSTTGEDIRKWTSGIFAKVREEIWEFWEQKDKEGMFDAIRKDVVTVEGYKWVYP